MVIKTYLDKINTIIDGSSVNTGLNPVSELSYGTIKTRMLLHFDVQKIKEILNTNGVKEYYNVKHYLKLTNCGFISDDFLHKTETSSFGNGNKYRASSFDLIFFLIPQQWDGGKGYEYCNNQIVDKIKVNDISVDNTKLVSYDGSNWFQSRNGYKWDCEGIYSSDFLSKEYDKFALNESSVIIARQHFDIGNENINVDISDVVNKFLKGEIENYGIGVAFTPLTELIDSDDEHYVGFFTHKTNTFFEPYLETTYDDSIKDDRNNFVLDKVNKLYLYCNIGAFLFNLDELPTCTINGAQMDVKHVSEGIYCTELMLSSKDYVPNTMLYDIWSNIKYKGMCLNDVEMDFVLKPSKDYFNIGNTINNYEKCIPVLSGIKYDEKISRGDKRKIVVTSKIEYSKNKISNGDEIEYRIYVKSGKDEITVIDYQKVNMALNENYFLIDTNMFVAGRYHVDLKYKYGFEEIYHHDVLSFDIVNELKSKFFLNKKYEK